MPKSLKTAFIRISAVNNTENGIIKYSYDDVKNIVFTWSKTKKFKYYVKDHNNEPGDNNPHYHLVLKFNTAEPFDDLKKHFPYGDIEPAKNVKNCVQYLVHMNDLSKTQYDFDEIYTNDDNINKYRLISATNQLLKLDDYIHQIDAGKIREYNLTESIPIEIFANHKPKILNALEYYRRKVMTNPDRNIEVMIFTGETGTFKTTYAKQYCRNKNKSFCVSSSSNDPMQDYKGEDVLILDDIRDTTFRFHDLLKVLDNHTSSSIASRYSNKAFIGDTIIITSSQPISDWYFNDTKEDKEQLYRRIPVQMQFTKDTISIFQYNERAHKYTFSTKIPNVNTFTPQKTKNFILDIVKSMGVEISEEELEKLNKLDDPELNKKTVGQYELEDMMDTNVENPFE